MKTTLKLGSLGCLLLALAACRSDQPAPAAQVDWAPVNSPIRADAKMEARITELISQMSVEQKVGQLVQVEIRYITPAQVKQYHIGSILNGGGTFPNNDKYASETDWVNVAETFYQASMDTSNGDLAIPVIWGTDAVHGHNNVIRATLFPHNIGLGATRNPELIRAIGSATAREVSATGVQWTFAPTVATPRDDRWGRTYEGYSEDPEVVRQFAAEMVKGIQGEAGTSELFSPSKMVATVKHFVGDGGTYMGRDRGDTKISELELRDIHAQGYFSGLGAGAQTVMASFNSWNGERLHGSFHMLTEVLKNQMGFDGFVVGDWNGHGFVPGCDFTSCAQAINAGLDMFMAIQEWHDLLESTIRQAKSGEIPMARLDDAVRRILRVKMRAGLFDGVSPKQRAVLNGVGDVLGNPEHRALARQAVRESLVLLKNQDQILPLNPKQHILMAGDGADNIGKQSGGWTLSWQGTGNTNADFPGATSIYAGVKSVVDAAGGKVTLSEEGKFEEKPDVAIVVFGENPYAEWQGDINSLEYQPATRKDLQLLTSLRAQGIPVVSVFLSGRPLWVNAELNQSNAFVAAFLPGSEGQGVADVIMAKTDGSINVDFKGKLSFSWPKDLSQVVLNKGDKDYQPLFPYGYGLSYSDKDTLLSNLPEDRNLTASGQGPVPLGIFESRVLDPWQIYLVDSEGKKPVTTNTAESAAVSLTGHDYLLQDDARRLIFSGTEPASVVIASDISVDFSGFLASKSSLILDLRVNAVPEGAAAIRLDCGEACRGAVDMSGLLKQAELNQWQKVSVDLQCFVDAGLKIDAITAPFAIDAASKVDLSLANIQLLPMSASDANISCQP
ncbi:exo 1,3/1,4-beta-D-glucan glucohydrolase [Simiduia litorea]|uniref:glycoside hydrolase family 3 protein n=1 Tax=Simiduia litorea TaxID=1435348 RepID=UPI0036F2712A